MCQAGGCSHFTKFLLSSNTVIKEHQTLALINVNVGPVLILQGSMVMERTVMAMENVRLVIVRILVLGWVVLVPAQERKTKARAAVGLAMTPR